ncbi:SDR family oxidoreductase [bacterium]|nr:SDR family oxidoreductase [bacterium]
MKKRALITGASEGIGRELARQLAQKNYSLTLVARNEERLKELVQELKSNDHQIQCADLSTRDGIEQTCQELRRQHYDVLINNAGFGLYSRFSEAEVQEYDQMLSLNCASLMRLSHEFLKNAQPGDALLNVASTLSFLPMAESAVYNATKAFVRSFSETLWYEQKDRGVFVMVLCPGITRTEFFKRAGGRIDQNFPGFLTQTPQTVASLALKELEKRSNPVVISGRMNQWSVFLSRFVPTKTLINLLGHLGHRGQRTKSN